MDERAELAGMSTDELVAYHNVLTMGRRMIQTDAGRNVRHLGMVRGILAERGVVTEEGRLLKRSG